VAAHVARLVPHKGARELVEAAALVRQEIPEAQFLLVGSALRSDRHNFEGQIRERIAELGLGDTVILAGPRADIPEILAACDVFALPTTFEGVPRSGIEAMASGLPTVMTAIRGCREETVEGETGHLVPVVRDEGTRRHRADIDALADRLTRLMGDAEMRGRMGEAAQRRARELYDERLVLEREWRVMRALLAERAGLDKPPRAPETPSP
jgi:glycosyltransferase involved in cell wall biosynthesis